MRKWNLPLTYEPKIQPVIDGTCRQTIRARRKFSVGDLVAFHGWQGKPRRSPWSFRTGYFGLKEVWEIDIRKRGIMTYNFEGYAAKFYTWNELGWLAVLDGIIPPTGEALRDVMMSKNKIPTEGLEAQIIRW